MPRSAGKLNALIAERTIRKLDIPAPLREMVLINTAVLYDAVHEARPMSQFPVTGAAEAVVKLVEYLVQYNKQWQKGV